MKLRQWRLAAAAAAVLLTAGCGGTSTAPVSSPTPDPPSSTGHPAAAPDPAKVQSVEIAWQPVTAATGEEVLTGADGTEVRISEDRRTATVTGDRSTTLKAGAGRTFTRAALDGGVALLVSNTESEGAGAQQATLANARTGKQRSVVDGPGPDPARSGSWALGGGQIAYTSGGQGQRYCLAAADVATLEGDTLRCGKTREGLTQLRIHAGQVGAATFVNATPMACMTLQQAKLSDTTTKPLRDATKCRGWEVVPLQDSAVWSEITRPSQIELGRVRGMLDGSVVELGQGSTGTLTGCGGWVYWSQPPGTAGGRHGDRLMRWQPGKSIQAVLDEGHTNAPITSLSCSDNRLSFVVLSESGDRTFTGPS